MHELGLSHNDIKLTNLMLDMSGNPKIIDFGFVSEKSKKNDFKGTLFYMNPIKLNLFHFFKNKIH